jgi:hypothetical protein
MNSKTRVILGSLFIIAQFIPLGAYHFVGEPHIVGGLYNVLFPHGMFTLIFGFLLIFYEKLMLERFIRLNYLLILGGALIILVGYYEPEDYILGLLHGVEGDFDTDGVNTGFPIGLVSVLVGMIKEVSADKRKPLGRSSKAGFWGLVIGTIASLGSILFWLVLLFFNPYDGGIEVDSLFPITLMIILAMIGLLSALKSKSAIMFIVFVGSFFPIGYYMLGTPGIFKWIGVFNAMYLPSAILMAFNNRKGEAER